MQHIEGIKRMIERQHALGMEEEKRRLKEVESLFSERSRVHIFIRGKVHGVFFRNYVKREADVRELFGWVRNRDDYVEVVAEGDKQKLRELIALCKKGSALSRVETVDYDWEEFSGAFNGFHINYA